MKYTYYLSLVGEAKKAKTEEEFAGDMGYPANIDLDTDSYLKFLHIIYIVANGTFKDLKSFCGLSLAALARKTDIPYKTTQQWDLEKRPLKDYIKKMIGYILINDLFDDAAGKEE